MTVGNLLNEWLLGDGEDGGDWKDWGDGEDGRYPMFVVATSVVIPRSLFPSSLPLHPSSFILHP
ncbi:hypothetical protein [Laspinema palackyanum]|uniref:hypothetical protein n=1 Tax=Laspinema palackyanum TaxID=3231601 RepID=UPI00345D3B06|nr:hypothetical protein [Laspinema sp. D2c]